MRALLMIVIGLYSLSVLAFETGRGIASRNATAVDQWLFAGDTPTNILQNPGFESGSASWTQYSSRGYSLIGSGGPVPAHTGSYYAWLAGDDLVFESLEQAVTIPANVGSAQLDFWYRISTGETSGVTAYDKLSVEVYNSAGVKLATIVDMSNLNATGGAWVQSSSFNLSAYRGQTIRIRFSASTDDADWTNFYLDDLRLTTTTQSLSQTITFGVAPSIRIGGTGAVSAMATSGLPVTFTSLTTAICTVSGSTVTGIAAGTCTIAANQSGNGTYGAAPQVTQNILVSNVGATATEFYHEGFGHYFVTASGDEAAAIDSGTIKGWIRTGQSYSVYSLGGTGLSPVCRFFSTSFAPKSSHFYTPSTAECGSLKSNRDWQFEANAFYVKEPAGGACASGTVPLYRIYNNGHSGAPNHRYTTCTSIRDNMISRGWVSEGIAMCVPGGSTNCATDNSGGGVNYNAPPATTPPAMPAITPPPGTVGVAYSFTYSAMGSAPISFSAIGLPPGLSMSSSGLISGTPTRAGDYAGIVTASNGTAPDATQSFRIVIQARPEGGCPGGGDSC